MVILLNAHIFKAHYWLFKRKDQVETVFFLKLTGQQRGHPPTLH